MCHHHFSLRVFHRELNDLRDGSRVQSKGAFKQHGQIKLRRLFEQRINRRVREVKALRILMDLKHFGAEPFNARHLSERCLTVERMHRWHSDQLWVLLDQGEELIIFCVPISLAAR